MELRNYTTEELHAELTRRARARRRGLCPQCERAMWSEPTCGGRDHEPIRVSTTRVQGTLLVVGPKGCGKTVVADELLRHARATCALDLEVHEEES